MKDLSDLPKASAAAKTVPRPDRKPRFGPLLAQAWADEWTESDQAEIAGGRRIRHSWAGNCARRLEYELTGVEVSNELTVADHWRFGIGSYIHRELQTLMHKVWPDAEIEKIVFNPDGLTSGHIDAIVTLTEVTDGAAKANPNEEIRIVIEIKSINGFGFKKAVGARGDADGPRYSAYLQGAISALLEDADELVIIYLSLENLSPREAAKNGFDEIGRFCAEWTFTRADYEADADAELKRLTAVAEWVDTGKRLPRRIPDPEIPKGATIDDPKTGRWMLTGSDGKILDVGTTWHCSYCPFQDHCAEDEG